MKQILLLFILNLFAFGVFSQDCPVRNDDDSIKKHHIKSISVRLNSITKSKKNDSLEMKRIEFDKNGKMTYEKFYTIFDMAPRLYEYMHTYNSKEQLIEKIETIKIYPFDSSLLKISAVDSSSKKWIYKYNQRGDLTHKHEFKDQNNENSILVAMFEYDKNGRKIKGVFKDSNFPNQRRPSNNTEFYQYDNNNNLVETKSFYTTNQALIETKNYDYDSNDNMTINAHSITGYSWKTHKTYQDNKLILIERYNSSKKGWTSKTIYEYSKLGYLTKRTFKSNSGFESIITFEYNEKGLLKTEYWYSDDGEKELSFETKYTYY